MSSSQKQKQTSDQQTSSVAAGHSTSASAATIAQPPTAARGGGAQGQAVTEAQTCGDLTEENPRQTPVAVGTEQQSSDKLSQIVCTSQTDDQEGNISQTDGQEGSSGEEEEISSDNVSDEPWAISQFLEDYDNVPVWDRTPHASRRAAKQFHRARAVSVIRDVFSYFPIAPRR